jgi:hypothetical protein
MGWASYVEAVKNFENDSRAFLRPPTRKGQA